VLQTQSEWVSSIHEILYEWRLNALVEYESMGGSVKLLNPHKAEITGKSDTWKASVSLSRYTRSRRWN